MGLLSWIQKGSEGIHYSTCEAVQVPSPSIVVLGTGEIV